MNDKLLNIAFYAFIILSAGVATYLKILPGDVFLAIFTGLMGHAGAALPAKSSTPLPVAVAPIIGGGNGVVADTSSQQ